jgi:CO/xanthine dehydrogenase Mo-binding subunit
VENASADGPYGAKGVGEPPIILPAAAIVNAVAAATGRVMPELPLTPERVLENLSASPTAGPVAARQENL